MGDPFNLVRPRIFCVQVCSKKGFFYSVNVEVSGLRGFSRRSARPKGWATFAQSAPNKKPYKRNYHNNGNGVSYRIHEQRRLTENR